VVACVQVTPRRLVTAYRFPAASSASQRAPAKLQTVALGAAIAAAHETVARPANAAAMTPIR
jgi:hypothetical protein